MLLGGIVSRICRSQILGGGALSAVLYPEKDSVMRFLSALCVVSLLATTACDNDPVGDAPKAQATAPAEVKEQPVEADSSQKLIINNQNSKIEFVGAKVTRKHDGKFNKFEGAIQLNEGDPTKSSVNVTIELKEVETDTEKLTGHLKSPDFFDVEKFPQAKFTSTKIEKGEKPGQYQVTGNLDLHGVTKSITFPATIQTGKGSVSVSAEFGINRQDFGIKYPGMPDDLIADEVLLKLKLDPTQA